MSKTEEYTAEETAKRMEKALRRSLVMPPKHHKPVRKAKKGRGNASDK